LTLAGAIARPGPADSSDRDQPQQTGPSPHKPLDEVVILGHQNAAVQLGAFEQGLVRRAPALREIEGM
jgi:hypothetical protein